jgi:uncharacterized protein (TIGR02246 family)
MKSPHRAAVDPRSAIAAVNRDFMEAYADGDAARIAGLYTENAQLLPPKSDVLSGRTAIGRYWREAKSRGVRKLETTELEIHGEAAFEVGRYRIETENGQESEAGQYVVIWKLDAGRWRMHRDIWTANR